MKEIQIKNSNLIAIVDDEDFERIDKFIWHERKGVVSRHFYVSLKYKTFWVSMAAEVMQQPKQMFDHINRNFLDNRKQNLRPCSISQNTANMEKKPNCSSQYKGVTWNKIRKLWYVRITKNNIGVHLGTFFSEYAAGLAYDRKAKELHGEFAVLNFPKGEWEYVG